MCAGAFSHVNRHSARCEIMVKVKKEEKTGQGDTPDRSDVALDIAGTSEVQMPKEVATVKASGVDANRVITDTNLESRVLVFDGITSIQDYINALQVNLRSTRQLSLDSGRDVLPLANVQLELPRKISKVDPFIYFKYGGDCDWCIVSIKWPHAGTSFSSYREWLSRLRHASEELAKQGYRYYCLQDKDEWQGLRTLRYVDIGFDESINSGSTDGVAQTMKVLRGKLIPKSGRDVRYELVTTCCPRSVSEVWLRMQNFIFDDVQDSKSWMYRFCDRKGFSV